MRLTEIDDCFGAFARGKGFSYVVYNRERGCKVNRMRIWLCTGYSILVCYNRENEKPTLSFSLNRSELKYGSEVSQRYVPINGTVRTIEFNCAKKDFNSLYKKLNQMYSEYRLSVLFRYM